MTFHCLCGSTQTAPASASSIAMGHQNSKDPSRFPRLGFFCARTGQNPLPRLDPLSLRLYRWRVTLSPRMKSAPRAPWVAGSNRGRGRGGERQKKFAKRSQKTALALSKTRIHRKKQTKTNPTQTMTYPRDPCSPRVRSLTYRRSIRQTLVNRAIRKRLSHGPRTAAPVRTGRIAPVEPRQGASHDTSHGCIAHARASC